MSHCSTYCVALNGIGCCLHPLLYSEDILRDRGAVKQVSIKPLKRVMGYALRLTIVIGQVDAPPKAMRA